MDYWSSRYISKNALSSIKFILSSFSQPDIKSFLFKVPSTNSSGMMSILLGIQVFFSSRAYSVQSGTSWYLWFCDRSLGRYNYWCWCWFLISRNRLQCPRREHADCFFNDRRYSSCLVLSWQSTIRLQSRTCCRWATPTYSLQGFAVVRLWAVWHQSWSKQQP